ncbi:11867_t:CDS:2, partial [Dentiscutata erythropus]
MTELVENNSSKRGRKFLFFLSFILSQKDYSNVKKILTPFINKFGLELPSNEEFKSTCNSQTHKHETAFGAISCRHDECLPKTSRTGITNFVKIIDSLFKTSSFRFALSISSFAIVYQTLLRFFTRAFDPLLGPRSRMNIIGSPLVPPFLAGLFAGPTLLIDNIESRRITISTYALCKSLQFIYSALRDNRIIPRMPWWWGAWLLFPISSSQTIYCYLIHPDIFP